MSTLLAFADAVDIGYGRGRLAAPAAASLRRVDAAMRDAFGRVLDVNEAWRSPEQADANYAAYQRYLAGGPLAPIALPAYQSIHCRGYALDTDDGYNARAVAILNDHGWFHTVYRWVNGKRVLVEPWHFEYDASRDNHRGDTAGGGATEFDPTRLLEDSMSSNPIINVVAKTGDDWRNGALHIGLDDGSFQRLQPPFATNIRGILGKAFYGGDGDGNKDTIPTLSQADFNALAAVWATMCKGRTDAAAVWSQGVHAQNADGHPLYIDGAGKITTAKTDRPLKFTAAGFLASTNAVVNELADDAAS